MAVNVKRRLGELLLDAGYINQGQLDEGLVKQKATGERLGITLAKLGHISEQSLIEVLEFQLGVPHVNLTKRKLDPVVAKSIPEHLARKYQCIAIERQGSKLILAMVDPTNVFAVDDLKLATNCDILPAIATEGDVKNALDEFYGLHAQDVLQGMDVQEIQEIEDESEENVEDIPIVKFVNLLISQAVKLKSSDIHIQPTEGDVRVRFRIDGALKDIMTSPRGTLAALVSRIKIMAHLDIAEKRLPQDGRIQLTVDGEAIDLRVSTLPTIYGEKVVMRILFKGKSLQSLDRLGFLPDSIEHFRSIYTRPYGIILVTGPTGSGKSTTLSAVLNDLNAPDKNIVTVEDPVEYEIRGISQVHVNRKAGLTFANALRSFLRQDPDIMMVGEIRDGETARIAVEAAMTGHLVLTTLHTNDAPSSLIRLVDMGIEPFLVASVVIGVLAQRLVRGLCRECIQQYAMAPDDQLRPIIHRELPNLDPTAPLTFYQGKGCRSCNNSGLSGRTGIHEIMVMNDQIREAVRRNASSDEIKKTAIEHGMRTLLGDGIVKAMNGKIPLEAVFAAAYNG